MRFIYCFPCNPSGTMEVDRPGLSLVSEEVLTAPSCKAVVSTVFITDIRINWVSANLRAVPPFVYRPALQSLRQTAHGLGQKLYKPV